MSQFSFLTLILGICFIIPAAAGPKNPLLSQIPKNRILSQETPEDRAIAKYFEHKVEEIEATNLEKTITSKQEWESTQKELRQQLKTMLALNPEPPRTDLNPVITGIVEKEDFVVEKLYFESMPGLYVTANLYRPKQIKEKLPAVLYLCGHGQVKKNGINYGNKTHYEYHGEWFAKHGYIALLIDTIELGEIHGMHHGTFRHKRWWWPSRGYTPAGVEAWNGSRAVDYLISRPEVDAERIGVTGRSGGGAYSWYTAAIDERIKAVAPTAGITSMRNHVIDGCLDGHCDCMFFVNRYQWDFDKLAALIAPRPLLILNTDKDSIFPLDGVNMIYRTTRYIYQLMGAGEKVGLHIAEGPHADTQALNVGAFSWMNRFLKGEEAGSTFDGAAKRSLTVEELKVFENLPEDEIVTTIDESFSPKAETPSIPNNEQEWKEWKQKAMDALYEDIFYQAKEFTALPNKEWLGALGVHYKVEENGKKLVLTLANELPWTGDAQRKTHLRRRFLLLGSSVEREQVMALRTLVKEYPEAVVEAEGDLAALMLYVAIEESFAGLKLKGLPSSHSESPALTNILKYFDLPQTLALAAEKLPVSLSTDNPDLWNYAVQLDKMLAWKNLTITK